MSTVKLLAPAKINLSLDIIGRMDNGYHELCMVMQSIDLYDTVSITENNSEEITISCSEKYIPCDKRNIAYKCADVFFNQLDIKCSGIEINIEKKIPSQAGLAGGSTDGAAVLVGLNHLYKTGLSLDELCEIGVKCGADIPFCIKGGTMLAEGIGEKLTRIAEFRDVFIALAKPNCGVKTVSAFTEFDKRGGSVGVETDKLINAIEKKDIDNIGKLIKNVLQDVCAPQKSLQLIEVVNKSGSKGSIMTGSGSAVFGIFNDYQKADSCLKKISNSYFKCVCKPIKHGVKIIEK